MVGGTASLLEPFRSGHIGTKGTQADRAERPGGRARSVFDRKWRRPRACEGAAERSRPRRTGDELLGRDTQACAGGAVWDQPVEREAGIEEKSRLVATRTTSAMHFGLRVLGSLPVD